MSEDTKVFVVVLALIAIAVPIFYFACFHSGFGDQTTFGTFGDFFGGTIGALTALISVVLIYHTYIQQVEISQKQYQQNQRMSFEQNFFNLLQVQRDITKSIMIEQQNPQNTVEQIKYEGYKAIYKIVGDVKISMSQLYYENDLKNWDFERIRRQIDILYSNVLIAYGDLTLGHYFRHLYHILRYIELAEVENKKVYRDFLQAQMSNEELFLLFFDSLSNYGYPKMYNVVSDGLLENLRYTEFDYFRVLCAKCYPNTKFKN